MKKSMLFIFMTVLFINNSVFANLPTEHSKPIPTLHATKNIDTVLSEKAQAAIQHTAVLKGQAVSAASHDQVVTLEGSVENKEQEQAAINAVKSLKDVKEVKSQLTIKLIP